MKILLLIILIFPNIAFAADIAKQYSTTYELYTSFNCPSCPPADDLFNELTDKYFDKSALLTLSFHVDYWDKKNRKDPYSLKKATARQMEYQLKFEARNIYTPQVIINGVNVMNGASKRRVNRALRNSLGRKIKTPIIFDKISPYLLDIHVGEGDVIEGEISPKEVWLIPFIKEAKSRIGSKELVVKNTVQDIIHLGVWYSGKGSMMLDLAKLKQYKNFAIIVQEGAMSEIIGAATYEISG